MQMLHCIITCTYNRGWVTDLPFKMASLLSISSFFVICIFNLQLTSAETRVELTTLAHPATVGGILAIQCQVWKMQDGYTVDLYRVLTNGHTDQITVRGNYYSQSSLGERGFLAKRSFSGGSMVLFLTVIDITTTDQSNYFCKVYSDLHGNYVEIARDSTDIEIYTFPK